jgi:tripartite-type tricarboxylate transporter receptor subunit TctC
MPPSRRRVLLSSLAAALCPQAAFAQSWPSRTIRIIVPWQARSSSSA